MFLIDTALSCTYTPIKALNMDAGIYFLNSKRLKFFDSKARLARGAELRNACRSTKFKLCPPSVHKIHVCV